MAVTPETPLGEAEYVALDVGPAHAALGDAQATAAIFRELVARGRERFGWSQVGDLLSVLPRPEIDRSRIAPGAQPPRPRGGRQEAPGGGSVSRRGSSGGRAGDAPG